MAYGVLFDKPSSITVRALSILIAFTAILSFVLFGSFPFFVEQVVNFGSSGNIVKNLSHISTQQILTTCDRYFDKETGVQKFMELISFLGIPFSLEGQRIHINADAYSALVRLFNWVWFLREL